MTGTGIAEIVLMMMILRSGVSMIIQTLQDVLHTALENGDEIAEKLAYEIEEEFINRPYTIPLSDDMWGPWFGMDRSLTLRTTTINMALLYSRENVAIIMVDRGANLLLTDQYGNTPLHIAAVRGLNVAVIKILDKIKMFKPQVIDIKNSGGDTPLHMAVHYNQNLIVERLLDKGADPSITDNDGNTPFHITMSSALTDEIMLSCIQHMNINHRNNKGSTLLHTAIKYERGVVVKDLVDRGADPSISDDGGNTPFHINMPSALTDEIFFSCIQHMNVNQQNNTGATLLHTAIQCKREVSVKHLLDRGANPIIANHNGLTALHLAIAHGLSQQIIIQIIHAGRPKPSHLLFQSGMTEHFYSSIIHRLIRGLNTDLVIEVFKLSCDGIINLRDQNGRSALFFAAWRGAEIAQLLLENGADPTITDIYNLWPFQDTSTTDEIFISMIQNVDVNHRYIDGSTILHFAIRLRRDGVVRYLLDKGANPTIADNFGNTALHRAVHSDLNQQILVHLLVAARPKAVCNLGQNGMTQFSGCLNGEGNHDDRQIGDCEIINMRNHKGQTALLLAFRFSRHRIGQLLFERGADPHLADNDGNTFLHFNMPGFLTDEFIISTIKTMNIYHHSSHGNTYLHQAAICNRENVIKHLLDRGANPKARNYYKNTVLHLAVEHNLSEQIVIDIIESKDLRQVYQDNMKSRCGFFGGLLSFCDLKLQDILFPTWDQELLNIQNWCGKTALHLAVSKQRVDLVRVLLKKGASRTIKALGDTALDLAIEKKEANSTPIAATIVDLFRK